MKSVNHHQSETEKNLCLTTLQTPVRTAYGPRYRVSITTPERELPFGRTKQSFKDECDINTILQKFQRTGLLEFVNERQPQYGDVPSIDFQEAMQTVAMGNEMFAELPSSWRKRFNNDPEEFLLFVQDPANRAEAVRLGIIIPSPVVTTGVSPAPPVGAPEGAKEPSKPA